LADTGELWAWGSDGRGYCPLGHGENKICPLPKPIESLRGIRLDAVAAGNYQALARADDGSVYAWGNYMTAGVGAPGLGPSVSDAGVPVPIPQRIPALRVACGF
jgi:alpha-tubulin suppressor-like RCC1 family protein